MLGAIIGDIVGSQFEWTCSKAYEFPLFTAACHFTDDSVATLGVADALTRDTARRDPERFGRLLYTRLSRLCRTYPDVGWGAQFYRFLTADPTPYGSFGNGAAMRISPVGWVADSEAEVIRLSRLVTGISHDHPDSFLAAEAVAMAIYLGRTGKTPDEVRARMEGYYPELCGMTVEGIRADYTIDDEGRFMTCAGSVPQAITCALEAEDFEGAVRSAVSLGGDADTQAAIAGSVAEALFGIPEDLVEEGLSYLDDTLAEIYYAFETVRHAASGDAF